jgi:hypothetical protein
LPVQRTTTTSVWRVALPHKPQEEAASRSACRNLPLLYTAPVVLRKAGPHLAVCSDERRTLVRVRITFLFLPVCAVFLVLTLSACSFSASSANISSAKMARDQDGKKPTETFSPNEQFYCIAELSNAPDDTKVKAVWTAVKVEGADPNTNIDEAKTTSGSGQLQFNLSNQGPWPTGDYKVDLYLNDAKEPTKTLAFKVE